MSIVKVVMDPENNPLRKLPSAQRFQIMVILSVMWTTIFCASAGAWFWYGELMIGHLLVALGIISTSFVFQSARPIATYRDFPVKDGTARYDDVWGGVR
jgi:hypothetical protein